MAIHRLISENDMRYIKKYGVATNYNARLSGVIFSAVEFAEDFPYSCDGVLLTLNNLTNPAGPSAAIIDLSASAITMSSFTIVSTISVSGWVGDVFDVAWEALAASPP